MKYLAVTLTKFVKNVNKSTLVGNWAKMYVSRLIHTLLNDEVSTFSYEPSYTLIICW